MNEFQSGEIINLVQTDSQKLFWFMYQAPYVMNLPFLIISCLTVLYYFLDYTLIAGIVVFMISFVVNIVIAKVSANYYDVYMKK